MTCQARHHKEAIRESVEKYQRLLSQLGIHPLELDRSALLEKHESRRPGASTTSNLSAASRNEFGAVPVGRAAGRDELDKLLSRATRKRGGGGGRVEALPNRRAGDP